MGKLKTCPHVPDGGWDHGSDRSQAVHPDRGRDRRRGGRRAGAGPGAGGGPGAQAGDVRPAAAQRSALVNYLLDGGTVVADACCGRKEFDKAFRAELKKMFPRRPLDRLELDHPVFRAFHKYSTVNFRTFKGRTKSDTVGPPD